MRCCTRHEYQVSLAGRGEGGDLEIISNSNQGGDLKTRASQRGPSDKDKEHVKRSAFAAIEMKKKKY